MDIVHESYFKWAVQLISKNGYYKGKSRLMLLESLHSMDFEWSNEMDENRASDGIDLRYRYAYENNYPTQLIDEYFYNIPCSIFEMLLALAIRCEETIMEDGEYGNRTDLWFWIMIDNLQLGDICNHNFYDEYVEHRISIFLEKEYDRNGRGGLFITNDKTYDMRTQDIWYQMCKFLNEYLSSV